MSRPSNRPICISVSGRPYLSLWTGGHNSSYPYPYRCQYSERKPRILEELRSLRQTKGWPGSGAMHHPAYQLLRIPLPRRWMNKHVVLSPASNLWAGIVLAGKGKYGG